MTRVGCPEFVAVPERQFCAWTGRRAVYRHFARILHWHSRKYMEVIPLCLLDNITSPCVLFSNLLCKYYPLITPLFIASTALTLTSTTTTTTTLTGAHFHLAHISRYTKEKKGRLTITYTAVLDCTTARKVPSCAPLVGITTTSLQLTAPSSDAFRSALYCSGLRRDGVTSTDFEMV